MRKSLLLISCLCLSLIVLSGCFRKSSVKDQPRGSDLLASVTSQSVMKKFSGPQEIKDFFSSRSPQPAAGLSFDQSGSDAMAARETSIAAPSGFGGDSFSTTNIQVAGVDEADIVKTDGNFIYAVSDKNLVIAPTDPVATDLSATIALAGRPQEIYIEGDKLIVFGYDEVAYAQPERMMIRPMSSYTFLAFYDISDRQTPKVLRNLRFEGGYSSSRLVDGRLYFITTRYDFYPADDFILPRVLEGEDQISAETSNERYLYPDVYYIDTPSSYNATSISVIPLDDINRPLYSQVYLMPSGELIYASHSNLYLAYTKYISDYELRMTITREMLLDRLNETERARVNQIIEIDNEILSPDEKAVKINQVIETYINRLGEAERQAVLGQLNEEFNERYENLYKELEKTVIHKIGFDDNGLQYRGAGEVSGRLLNQFSMDEYEGNFRLATTRAQSWIMPFSVLTDRMSLPPVQTQDSYNNVYVLNGEMQRIGTLENLAKGERIYSVRFMGNRAYVVTFKQVDPLFVIDLSEPSAPRVAGEVKLPGFSNYLHPYDENVLIGVGKTAIDRGEAGVVMGGLKISLFDVSDPAVPREITALELGGQGSDSPVLYEHRALLFSRDRNLLVLPAALTRADSQNYTVEFQGALVFDIAADRIRERGRISHSLANPPANSPYTGAQPIQRSLYVGDYLYTLSPVMLQRNRLDSLAAAGSFALPLPDISIDKPLPYDAPLR